MAAVCLSAGAALAGCGIHGEGRATYGPEPAASYGELTSGETTDTGETAGAGEAYGETAILEGAETAGGGETAVLEGTETAGGNAEKTAATVAQSGPFGEIRISLPPGWEYELCPAGTGGRSDDSYGIRFWPAGEEGYVELSYAVWFGVCGTGLSEETATVAGNKAYIGTYDDHAYWDFINFEGEADGVVASTFSVESWWEEYGEQVLPILDTLRFDANVREGSAQVAGEEEIPDFGLASEIGLTLSLENITPTGRLWCFVRGARKRIWGS